MSDEYVLYKHKKSNLFISLPKFNSVNRSYWKLKKKCQVNPNQCKRFRLFITFTVQRSEIYRILLRNGIQDNEYDNEYDNEFNLSEHIRKTLNRINMMIKKRRNMRTKPIWLWKIEFGKKSGRIHVHLLTNLRYLNYKGQKDLSYYVKNVWKIAKINKFEVINDPKKAMKYVNKYFQKEYEDSVNVKNPESVNRIVKYSRLWSCSHEFKFQYETIFEHTNRTEMQYQKCLEENTLNSYVDVIIDFNPLHHRKLIKKPEKNPLEKWYDNFKGSKKGKAQIFVWKEKWLKLKV